LLAEQGHEQDALRVAEDVLTRQPDNEHARALQRELATDPHITTDRTVTADEAVRADGAVAVHDRVTTDGVQALEAWLDRIRARGQRGAQA